MCYLLFVEFGYKDSELLIKIIRKNCMEQIFFVRLQSLVEFGTRHEILTLAFAVCST